MLVLWRRAEFLVISQIRIINFLQAFFAEKADQAFMQHKDVCGLRGCQTGDPAIGGKRNQLRLNLLVTSSVKVNRKCHRA